MPVHGATCRTLYPRQIAERAICAVDEMSSRFSSKSHPRPIEYCETHKHNRLQRHAVSELFPFGESSTDSASGGNTLHSDLTLASCRAVKGCLRPDWTIREYANTRARGSPALSGRLNPGMFLSNQPSDKAWPRPQGQRRNYIGRLLERRSGILAVSKIGLKRSDRFERLSPYQTRLQHSRRETDAASQSDLRKRSGSDSGEARIFQKLSRSPLS